MTSLFVCGRIMGFFVILAHFVIILRPAAERTLSMPFSATPQNITDDFVVPAFMPVMPGISRG